MAIKASASVTLSCYRDTLSVTRYYKLQSSTASAPSKPTTNPPSGWTDAEPSYTSESTNTLYFCDISVFSDGTWSASTVSKSSSYEAAKEAYNKAQGAQDSVDETSNELHQIIVDQNIEIKASYEAAIQSALEAYQTTGDFEEFRNAVENAIRQMETDIANNQTSTTDRINNVEADLLDKYNHLSNWIHIDTETGTMTFGSSENKITLTIENDMIVFKKNGNTFGHWDGVDFHTGNIIVDVNERAQFGNFAFVPRSDGSLSFLKVSDGGQSSGGSTNTYLLDANGNALYTADGKKLAVSK